MPRKRKQLTEEMLINWWLEKYHNITLEDVKKLHPDWNEKNSQYFYDTYPVTEEQHDEWRKWAFNEFWKWQGMGKRYAEKSFTWVYLNCAPKIVDAP